MAQKPARSARTTRGAKSAKGGKGGKSSKAASAAAPAAEVDASAADSGETPSFEAALEALETTVGRLEEGEMPLEEALGLFERGVALSRACTATLEAAEKRIEILVADRGGEGGWTAEPFEDDIDSDADPEADDEDFEEDLEEDD